MKIQAARHVSFGRSEVSFWPPFMILAHGREDPNGNASFPAVFAHDFTEGRAATYDVLKPVVASRLTAPFSLAIEIWSDNRNSV